MMISYLFSLLTGYIAWHGRYSAYDYGSYAAFMRHTFSEVGAVPCPVFKCDSCKNDTSVDDETVGKWVSIATITFEIGSLMIRPAW